MKSKIVMMAITILAVFAAVAAISGWYTSLPKVLTQWLPAPQVKIVEKIKRIEVPVEKIITIEKEVVVEKLKLPDWIKNDANKQIIATAEIDPYEGKTNTAALFDTKTGVGEIIAKQQSMPLFGLENKKGIGIRYGYNTAVNGMVPEVYGRWDFLRVGNIHTGIYAEESAGDGKSNGKIMLNIEYRW
jgi:hypothetical protein